MATDLSIHHPDACLTGDAVPKFRFFQPSRRFPHAFSTDAMSAVAHSLFRICVLLFTIAYGLSVTPSVADEPAEEHPVIVEVRQQLGDRDPNKPFMLLVGLKVAEGQGKSLERAIAVCRDATREEPGNVRYQLLADPTDPNRYQLSEQWKSVSDLKAHMKTPHLLALLNAFESILNGDPELKVFVLAGRGGIAKPAFAN